MIGAYLTESITLKQYKGEDEYGTPGTRTELTVKARIDYKNRQVTNLAGETVISMAKVAMQVRTIVRSAFSTRIRNTIAYEDVVTFDGIDHAIISIGKQADFSTRFLEVYVA